MFFDHEHCVCNDKMNSEKHLYVEMDDVEKKRRGEDLLYCILMDPDSTKLTEVCVFFVKQIKEKYPTRSNRFDVILENVLKEQNRLIKHSLIFFALYQEPWAVDYFLKNQKTPPTKLSEFVQKDLKKSCEELLRGAFTSLQSFCEDVRWNYVII